MWPRIITSRVYALTVCTTLFQHVLSDENDTVPIRLLMDVDTGVDDAMAITFAGTSPNVCLEAITVVAGNTNLSNAYNNTLRVLKQINRTDVPVYKGADRPIDGFWNYEAVYFGEDNFGNAGHLYDMGENKAGDIHQYGYVKMMELIKNQTKQLTLMMLGPLTNLAIALLVEPNITQQVKAIYILGGNIYGKGNILPGSEFNFLTDPEAALVVLQRAECPVYIVPWETVLDSVVPWVIFHNITNKTGELQQFLFNISNHTVQCCHDGRTGYSLGDWMAMLAAVVPDSVIDSVQHRVSVELTGTQTRGQLVHAWMPYMLTEVKRNVTIIKKFNQSIVNEYFSKTFDPPVDGSVPLS
uniref:Inosine-uridine preferring nucleoside hydrolase n=1 Tax=Rhipicephalus zambeziensis TaxID=60191 RepID=A0A224Z021_9ACAR